MPMNLKLKGCKYINAEENVMNSNDYIMFAVAIASVVYSSNMLFKAWRNGNKRIGLIFGCWVALIVIAIKIIKI